MLIPNQNIKVKVSAKTKNHYNKLGYNCNMGEDIVVPIEHLTIGCHSKILLKCDICNETISREYKAYIKKHNEGLQDICWKCQKIKAKETWIKNYGVDHPFKSDIIIEKKKTTWIEHYGVDNPSKSLEIKEKKRKSYQEHYGVDNPSQNYEIRCKIAKNFYNNGSVPTSKPQILMYEKLKNIYENCELNYPCGKYSLDCMIEVDDCKIDVEYDGIIYHKDKVEKDKIRNDFMISQGYKILRIQGNGKVPNEDQLKHLIENLISSNEKIKIIKYI